MAVESVLLLNNPVQLVFTGGITPMGVYDGSTAYSTGESVSYNGSSYVAIQATTGNLPTNTTYWQVLASEGATGTTGATGEAGAPGVVQAISNSDGTITIGGTSANPTVSLASPVAIANGGTGSATQNFVDLSSTQTIGGYKTFTGSSFIVGALLKINAPTGNPEFDLQLAGVNQGKVYFDTTANQLVFQNNQSSGFDSLYFANPANMSAITPHSNLNSNYNLGSSSLYWSNLYAQILNINSTASISGTTAGTLAVTGNLSLNTPLAISSGGTGSATQNFVDLSNTQTVGGNKTWSGTQAFNGSMVVYDTFEVSASGNTTSINTGNALNFGQTSYISVASGSSLNFQVPTGTTTLQLSSSLILCSTYLYMKDTIAPYTTLTYTNGDSAHYWSGLYSQTLNLNSTASLSGSTAGEIKVTGLFMPEQAATASAPPYVLGAMYFDTTLNKLRIGGASGWETVTSV